MTRQGGWAPSGFGAALKRLRQAAGLTQGKLAEMATCHRFTIAKLEQDRQEPAWPLVLLLADALGVEVTAFRPDKAARKSKEK
jgi:transcriptional regulator with XRE-family HTH domain